MKLTNELHILIESLEKKVRLLDFLLADSKKQEELAKLSDFNAEQFDLLVDHKDELLGQMDELDQGFDVLFSRIKDDLLMHQMDYSEEIKKLQELIKTTVDYGAQVSATEMRVKEVLSNAIYKQREELAKRRISSQSVMNYYKTSNQLGHIEPYFLDQKK